MKIMEFVRSDALILVPFLWVIGAILKKTPRFQNWLIPWILLFVSIVISLLLWGLAIESVFQGVLTTGIAVFGHELYKETFREKKT